MAFNFKALGGAVQHRVMHEVRGYEVRNWAVDASAFNVRDGDDGIATLDDFDTLGIAPPAILSSIK